MVCGFGFVDGCLSFVVCRLLLYCLLFVCCVCYLLVVVRCSLCVARGLFFSMVCCSLFVVCCLLFVLGVCCSLFVFRCSLFVFSPFFVALR